MCRRQWYSFVIPQPAGVAAGADRGFSIEQAALNAVLSAAALSAVGYNDTANLCGDAKLYRLLCLTVP